jgi:hypothetical protein
MLLRAGWRLHRLQGRQAALLLLLLLLLLLPRLLLG